MSTTTAKPGFTTLAKSEYEAYRGGQNAALRLTLALWLVAIAAVVGLHGAVTSALPIWAVAPIGALLFAVIGWCQASLSNGFHEAMHENFGARHSDRLSAILLGYPTFFTLCYRRVHTTHHVKGGDPIDDPDHVTYGDFPRSRLEMIGRFAGMLTGAAAARQVLARFAPSAAPRPDAEPKRSRRPEPKPGDPTIAGEAPWLVATQAAIAGGFVALFGWPVGLAWYVGFWILPLGTVAKTIKATRSFCEHGSPDRDFVLRTITGKPWQTGTLGMFGFHYHAEHHLYPWVPYARLRSLHERLRAELVASGETRLGRYEVFDEGYLGLLVVWFEGLPWTAPRETEGAAR